MNRRGGIRWQMWAAGTAFVMVAWGGFAGCGDDETTDPGTATGAGTGTGTATTSTGTGTGSTSTGTATTTTTTSDPGCGGAAACEEFCDEAKEKFESCFDEGTGGGGGAGTGGGGGAGTGGSHTWDYDCDEQGWCYSRCIMDSSCLNIRLQSGSYGDCVGCCNDPYLC